MLNVIVFGAPGSGKGTQSEKLINQYGLHHISTGEVLRHPEKTAKGVIFDGFPRTIPQALELKKMLAERNTSVNAVIGLEVSEDDLIQRMLRRGQETGRADDNIDTIKKRLDVYHNQTSPLREYYLNEGQYIPVDGNRSVDEIFADIKSHLDKQLD